MDYFMLFEIKQRPICQRCGGQLIRSYEGISCLQCSATHTEEGELVSAYAARKFQALMSLPKMTLQEGRHFNRS